MFECALSDRCEEVTLTVQSGGVGTGQHTIMRGDDGGTVVEAVTGDSLVGRGVPAPTVMKIDVEGAEHRVLTGLERTLAREDCRLVYCEIHEGALRRAGTSPDAVDELLHRHGFETRRMERHKILRASR